MNTSGYELNLWHSWWPLSWFSPAAPATHSHRIGWTLFWNLNMKSLSNPGIKPRASSFLFYTRVRDFSQFHGFKCHLHKTVVSKFTSPVPISPLKSGFIYNCLLLDVMLFGHLNLHMCKTEPWTFVLTLPPNTGPSPSVTSCSMHPVSNVVYLKDIMCSFLLCMPCIHQQSLLL